MSSVSLDSFGSILLVKTEESFATQATLALKEVGYNTFVAQDQQAAQEQLKTLQAVLVIIDYTNTGEWGLQFCRELRNSGTVIPIIMVIDEATLNARVACLTSGCDDYLVKPYYTQSLLKLVNLYLNHQEKTTEQLRFSDLVLDLNTRRLLRNSQIIDLTMKEFELLKYLMSHPLETLTREQILENVWGYDFQGASNVIEVYIRYLRQKIEPGGQKRLIQTVRGVGYVLKE